MPRTASCRRCAQNQPVNQFGRCQICGDLVADMARHNFWGHMLVWGVKKLGPPLVLAALAVIAVRYAYEIGKLTEFDYVLGGLSFLVMIAFVAMSKKG